MVNAVGSPEHLPALIARASRTLAAAQTSGEVLEARDAARTAYDAAKSAGRMARARAAHDEVLTAVRRAQADALLIEARAKVRLADEYDAAQERGEVIGKSGGGDSTVVARNAATAADLGLRRDEIHDARRIRDAEAAQPGVAARVLEDHVRNGEEPTRAALRRSVDAILDAGATEDDVLAKAREIRARRNAGRRQEKLDAIAATAAFRPDLDVSRRYPVIYADPPWRFEAPPIGNVLRGGIPYPTMTLDELKALPVADLATPDAVLFLWVTNPHVPAGLELMAEWGFAYKANLVWDKVQQGLGYYVRNVHELLLIGVRGAMIPPHESARPRSIFREHRGEHSAKPEGVRALVERAYPDLPRIELFHRGAVPEGWTAWGNQSGQE